MSICPEAELDGALQALNHTFAPPAHAITRRCKIALGANLILAGMVGLDASAQTEVSAWLTAILHLVDPLAPILHSQVGPAAGVSH